MGPVGTHLSPVTRVTDPVTGSGSSVNTCVTPERRLFFTHLLRFISSPQHTAAPIWSLPHLSLHCFHRHCARARVVLNTSMWPVRFHVRRFLMSRPSLSRLQIRKLRRELDASQEKVSALTTQLSANVSERALKTHADAYNPEQCALSSSSVHWVLNHVRGQ